jgi:hypothetical protein
MSGLNSRQLLPMDHAHSEAAPTLADLARAAERPGFMGALRVEHAKAEAGVVRKAAWRERLAQLRRGAK